MVSVSSLGVSKKTEKPSKPRKKTTKKTEPKKKPSKPIIFFVKIFGSVSVYETGNRQNPNRTEPVRFKGYYKYEKKTLSHF
jgi:hypothetical protein